ncbi:MAG: UDP-N-acetylmuramoyl-L-alanyl-D-glutamate--2,6-diaminopimelate ligase [Azonexus sp.]|nr:UDP-N-acetylmuramoyl-L-alanyl-D-glutamate--2,6-diaminopimelate ligase [Azonexus sp.]
MSAPRELLDRLEAMGVVPTGVADDSRQVRPGDLFLAYPGDLADGRRYIADALARGAVAVFWQPGGDFDFGQNFGPTVALPVHALRPLAGPLAHMVYGHPSENLSLIAITGTNGKTTISQCLARAYPKPCAIIGTLGAGFPDALVETGFTTPEATTLMRYLAEFRAKHAAACALEASSIGIEEGRMNGARVDVAVFTNFTRDHLDYHGSMEAYADAKEKLFHWPRLRTAIINLDDEFGLKLMRETSAMRVLGYAIGEARRDFPALVRAENLVDTPSGQSFSLVLPNGRVTVETGLVGRYNISNLLAVAAVLHDAGLPAAEVARRVAELTPPPGRMERVGGNGEPLVVIDYAHTPDALENALQALRDVATPRGGRLCVVFGCGGDRDKGKRPQMGQIAERLADRVLVTSDNPRSESPQAIIDEILAGMTHAEVEADRATAIRRAVVEAGENDVILLAGKGHEPYQDLGSVRLPFSDVEQAQAALALRRNQQEEAA